MPLPLLGVTSYVFDGIYIGATWTRAMLLTMAAAFALYGLLLLVTGPLGNHGLWLAFSLVPGRPRGGPGEHCCRVSSG